MDPPCQGTVKIDIFQDKKKKKLPFFTVEF